MAEQKAAREAAKAANRRSDAKRLMGGVLGRWWKPALGLVGLLAVVFFFRVYQQVLTIVQKPSWPPGAGSDHGRRRAGRDGAVRRRTRAEPADVGVPYAWSTAATIDPWPEGKNFFPRIFDDIEQREVDGRTS